MTDRYILNDKTPVAEPHMYRWEQWFQNSDRRVANTRIGDSEVSTVFLGSDHRLGDGPPLLFETLVFGGPLDNEMARYSTWEEAEAGHAAMVARVEAAIR